MLYQQPARVQPCIHPCVGAGQSRQKDGAVPVDRIELLLGALEPSRDQPAVTHHGEVFERPVKLPTQPLYRPACGIERIQPSLYIAVGPVERTRGRRHVEEELAAVGAPVQAVLQGLVVGQAPYLSARAAYQIDLVVRWIFQTMGDGIGYEGDLRALRVGSNLLDFIGTGGDRPGQQRAVAMRCQAMAAG